MIVYRQPEEIPRWYLAFHVKRGDWKHEWLIPGRFSHVSAFAYSFLSRTWILLDFSPRRSASVVLFPPLPDELEIPPGLALWTVDCGILMAEVRKRHEWRFQFGLTCVEAIKELVGSKSGALSPEGLWRDLLSEGATLVHDLDQRPRPEARPGRCRPA